MTVESDLLRVVSAQQANLFVSSGNFPYLITSIDTSLGGQIEISYTPINSNIPTRFNPNPVYTKDTDAQYPVMDVQAPHYVVDTHTADNGTGQSFTFTYAYGGAKYHHLGRGWLGFRWMRVVDETARLEPNNELRLMLMSEFRQVTTPDKPDFPLIGMLKFSETNRTRRIIALSGLVIYQSEIFSKVNNTYAVRDTQPGLTLWSGEPRMRFPELIRTDNFQCDGQPNCLQTASQFTYDINGNSTLTRHLGDVAITGDERDEVTEWIVDSTNWLHRPKRTALLDHLGATVREKWLYYDNQPHGSIGTRGLLTKEESRLAGGAGNAGNPTITHTYDGFGNRRTTTNPLICPITTTVETRTNTFPATVTNCLSHTTTFTWDPRHGVKLTETDPNNQLTTFTFDFFGRPKTVVGPKDSAQFPTVIYDYLSWGDPTNQRIQVQKRKDHLTAAVISKVDYFDGLGRFDLIESTGPNHPVTGQPRTIIEEVLYDSRNLIVAKTPARFNDEPMLPVWDYIHDVLGRQIRVDHPDSRFAETIYAPGKVTLIDERGIQKEKFLDAYGRVIRIHEKDGANTYVTTYDYDAPGALTHVQNHLGHHTRIKYDSLGRKIAMCDPNMGAGPNTTTCEVTPTPTPGAWRYTYDKAGNLLTQTDAKNQTLTFTYDTGSRVKQKISSAGTITYTYDDPAVPFSKGRLTKIQDLNSMVTTFLYDKLGRVTQTQRTIDGLTYTMSQDYNALGGVTTETFPDLDGVTYTYNEAGWLKAVNGYVNRIDYNARGQREKIDYVNAVSTALDYFDNNGTPDFINFAIKSRLTSGPSGTLQNLSYGYDEVNNVETITDALFTASRTFTYDDLNRLTSGSGTFGANQSQVTQNYSYNAIGNILSKAGITYSYNDLNHPSFVTNTSDGKTYTADVNGNTQNGAGRTFAWTVDNRVASVTNAGGTTNMRYDYTGARLKKQGPLGLTVYPFAGYEVGPDGTKIKFFKAGNELLAARQIKTTGASTKLFYHNDHLGGINVITDDVVSHNGARQQLIEYDPWGKISRSEGTNLESERRFTGQILDPEFGLYYYGARYYDPELARFISPDPIVPSPGDPQTLNRYSYVRNNPVKYIDPTGHDFWSDLGNFFKNFFKSLPALITGIVVGWATWGIGIPILSGMLGGMAAAAVNTAMNGGNFGYNIGIGALFGGLAGAVGPPLFGALGGGPTAGAWGNFVAALKLGAVTGAAVGGVSTAINGGNFFQNVAFGALGGAMGAAVGYGVSYGLAQGSAAVKAWWNSMPGATKEQLAASQTQRPDRDITCDITPSCQALQGEIESVGDKNLPKQCLWLGPLCYLKTFLNPAQAPKPPAPPAWPQPYGEVCAGGACESADGVVYHKESGEPVGANYSSGVRSGANAMGGAGAWTPPRPWTQGAGTNE